MIYVFVEDGYVLICTLVNVFCSLFLIQQKRRRRTGRTLDRRLHERDPSKRVFRLVRTSAATRRLPHLLASELRGLDVQYNERRLQSGLSNVCGQCSVVYLLFRCRCVPMKTFQMMFGDDLVDNDCRACRLVKTAFNVFSVLFSKYK